MSNNCLADLSLVAAGQALARGEVSAAELLDAVLERAAAVNPRINAFLRIDAPAARAQAQAIDATRMPGSALRGIPMAHKDMFFRAGMASSCGSRVKLPVPSDTASVLRRLDAAGAIQFGVLNMAEFAFGPTGHNWAFGHCRNPWNPDYITGGSSSGSAAAVAARATFAALGSDTGASIRVPAACCGVTGLKSTTGLVSRAHAMGLSFSLDTIGPLARSAEDCALVMQAIAGLDTDDASTDAAAPPDFLAGIERPLRGLRVGIDTGYFAAGLDLEVARVVDESRRVLSDLGCVLVPVRCPDMESIDAAGALVTASEGAALHASLLRTQRDTYARQVAVRLERGAAVPAVSYIQALSYRAVALSRFCHGVFGQVDVLHTPVLPILTPRIDATDVQEGEALDILLSNMTRLTRPFNYLGLPALSLPAGFASNGLPVGMQLVGPPRADALLLRVGHAFQSATDWHLRAPPAADALPSSSSSLSCAPGCP